MSHQRPGLTLFPGGKQEDYIQPRAKVVRLRFGVVDPIAAPAELDGLTAKFDELSNLKIDRHRPLVAKPVEGEFRVQPKRPKICAHDDPMMRWESDDPPPRGVLLVMERHGKEPENTKQPTRAARMVALER
jgi:hypothetical protein